jgi:hypothetical protein
MNSQHDNYDLGVYCGCLQSAKLRLQLAEKVTLGQIEIDEETVDAEFALLQIRKSLELVAFASIAAHKDIYAREYADFATHWNAKKLLPRLAKLHPDFYPNPIRIERTGPNRVHLTHMSGHELTQDEFVALYDICSKALHEWNPYLTQPRILDTQRPISEWLKRIHNLLELHAVTLLGSKTVWIVEFNNPDTGTVRAHPAVSLSP